MGKMTKSPKNIIAKVWDNMNIFPEIYSMMIKLVAYMPNFW